ncbi:uroporphyrinogen decarboxylase family protein [candidate division KSB1 bacterium]
MTSKERLLSVWSGNKPDHIPLTTQCFGFKPKEELTWERNGKPVKRWYTKRLEHIHTLPQNWEVEDDFRRALTWKQLGIDDIIDISIPWSINPEAVWEDSIIPLPNEHDSPVMVRRYTTPSGELRHAVKKTQEESGEGWIVQPDYVPLFEDYNMPRGVEHAVNSPENIPVIRHLYAPPDNNAEEWFNKRMNKIEPFSTENGFAVQAWACFGMDAVLWLTGVDGAILMAMDNPESFSELCDIVAETDYARAELACKNPAVDMIVQRGWYSGTDFWSPDLFKKFVYPGLKEIVDLVHKYDKKFCYVITTGIETMGKYLINADIDVLAYIDPVQDSITIETAKEMFCDKITISGGFNSISLNSMDKAKIEDEVKYLIDELGPTNRFILHPLCSLFPDTPWEGVEMLIEAWDKCK